MANTFGALTDHFSLAGESGKLENFSLVSSSDVDMRDNASARDENGEYVAATDKNFNERTEITCEYEANIPGAVGEGVIAINNVGGYIDITRIAINTSNTSYARVVVTGHKHGTTAHNTNARNVTLPAFNGFGAANFMGTDFAAAATEIQSSSWEANIEHVDRMDNDGDFLCGRSQGLRVNSNIEAISDTEPVFSEGTWIWDSKEVRTVNNDFYMTSASAHRIFNAGNS